jgi:hypothetical protein
MKHAPRLHTPSALEQTFCVHGTLFDSQISIATSSTCHQTIELMKKNVSHVCQCCYDLLHAQRVCYHAAGLAFARCTKTVVSTSTAACSCHNSAVLRASALEIYVHGLHALQALAPAPTQVQIYTAACD